MIKENIYKLFSVKRDRKHLNVRILGLKFKLKTGLSMRKCNSLGICKEEYASKLIVSLTSYPDRINSVYKVIESLLTQSLKPNMVILWLAQSQFPNKEDDLPLNLIKLKEFGLDIKWCKDIKSFKKLIPIIKEYPNDIIVTADDDLYYDKDWLKILYSSYLTDKKSIHAHRIIELGYIQNKLVRVSKGKKDLVNTKKLSCLNLLNSGAGVLFPPHSFYKELAKEDVFLTICPTNDDVWFWAMTILNGCKIRIVENNIYDLNIIDETKNSVNLDSINQGLSVNGQFIIQLNKVLENYAQLSFFIKKEL